MYHPITGRVWFRESTQEWVLELSGCINGCCFTSRHTAPKDTKPEDVPGLGHIYRELDRYSLIDDLMSDFEKLGFKKRAEAAEAIHKIAEGIRKRKS